MSSSTAPCQEELLHTRTITEEMEKTLMESLVTQKMHSTWPAGDIPVEAWKVARLAVNDQHRTCVSWQDVLECKELLFQRYTTWRDLCITPGVQYDAANNVCYATNAMWKQLYKKNYLMQAYRREGEPEFHNLSIIFGRDDLKQEYSKTVINISSTMQSPSPVERTVVLSEEDEVTSPVFKSTRRKLFTSELPDNSDEISTSNVDKRFAYIHPLKANVHRKPVPVIPARKKGAKSSSSCASNSPVPRYNFGPYAP